MISGAPFEASADPRPARWSPANWPLRTKLAILTVLPLGAALVLGAILLVQVAEDSPGDTMRDLGIIAVIVIAALVVLVVLARSILDPLRVLRASALEVADRRLPAAIERLRHGDGGAGAMTVDPIPVYTHEDVGQLARALDAVHGQALRMASEQAALRANVNDMFRNLARRSQSLVERQLQLIDELELSEQDADQLAALFRLDHLATRIRRNCENLLVLAGADLRQRAGTPVPVLDVVRAAASEIEDYPRVAVPPLPNAMVAARAVNDVVHLIAELLDNATSYSDPESPVTLSARTTDHGGLVIEICDEGTGIPRARLVEINQRLTAPPPVDVSASRQMGLFVVGKLATRHGITVELTSAQGPGITVTVTLPPELVAAEPGTIGVGTLDDRVLAPALPAPLTPSASNGTNGTALGSAPPRLGDFLDDSADTPSDTLDTPIFTAMLSKWFTGAPDAELTDPPDTVAGNGWGSAADAGWLAAEAASAPTADELTPAGLPKRAPGAFLVPGSVADNGAGAPAAAGARSADTVRDRMSSFQRGLRHGRHGRPAGPADQLLADYDHGRHLREAGGEPTDHPTEATQ